MAAAVRVVAAAAALLAASTIIVAPAAAADDAQQRALENDRRFLQGRAQSLDSQLAPYDRDRLRVPPAVIGGGGRDLRHDPLSERLDLERRQGRDRQRLIEQEQRR